MLIMETGLRPGSDRDTKAEKQAFGATTLEGRHVDVDSQGNVTLKFTGKKGVQREVKIEDKNLAEELAERKKTAGSNDRLFDTSASKLRDYVKTLDGGRFKPKDMRTRLGTEIASDIIASQDAPGNGKAYKRKVREVAKQVAERLGNTPAVALQSYIDPTVFSKWREVA